MNDVKKIRVIQWSLALLLLCNVGLIAAVWLRPAGGGPKHETPRDYVIRNLEFTDKQVEDYDVLIAGHQHSMRRLRREAMELRQQLFSGLKGEDPGATNKDSIATLIALRQQQIETVTYDHFAQVRKICTAQQKPEFDKIIGDVIKKMNGGMHGPPPHGREGERGGPPQGDGPPPPDGHGPPPR
ncbi:MAG: hypothetical protein V4649_08010 [Bacteroidota bacterium]